ncbi:MAG: TetR/AcrR family transcriptional regulator [Pseudomonadota bacterium]|nr:TetR/AcrR family transcriptional regulator [Pseudomonadota bacterium]
MAARVVAKARARVTRHRTPRKEEILDVAAGLFAEHGFDAVSLTDIADAVGLSKATLYHYFSRKEEILGTIVVTTVRDLNAFIDGALAGISTPEARLTAFLEAQADFFEQHPTWFQVLLTRFSNLTDRKLRDEAVEWRVNYENTIKGIIRDGVNAGVFSTDRPNSVVRAVLASVYWLARWYRPNGPQRARDIAREYADVVLYGVATKPRPRLVAQGTKTLRKDPSRNRAGTERG